MIHIVPVEWHDLIEDPSDLPAEEDGYLVAIMNKSNGNILEGSTNPFARHPLVEYTPRKKVWFKLTIHNDDDWEEHYYESYGTSAIGDIKYEVDDEFVVVAWAKFPADYIPQKLQGG